VQYQLDPRWQETADALAIPLEDLLTVASYETGGTMDPLQRGPTTQWGQHAGLIQFGEPQAKKYGVDFTNAQTAMDSQLGANGAIVNYMLDHGFVPNQHSGMDIYSTINAGGPNLYNRSDANNGGAAGTVADKWNYQMGGHRQNAAQMMGGTYNPPASSRSKRRMAKDGSNMMQQQQPQGLLGRLTNRNESTGLNLMESFAAGLDPLIMPSMRIGDAIIERGDKRVEQGNKNRTIDFLRTNGRNDLAQMVSQGMISPKEAAAQILTPRPDNRTAGMQNYEYLVSNGVPPEEAMQRAFGKGGTNINVNTGPDGDEFFKKTAGNLATQFGEYSVTGANASRNIFQLDMLDTFLDNSSTGFKSGLAQKIYEAGGPNFQGDDEQAAATIINQLIPAQRPAGSGTTSDRDMELYRASLPSIRNSAGGNKLIVKSMKALMQYDIDRAALAGMAQFGEITPQEAMRQINALPDPFESVRQFMGVQGDPTGSSSTDLTADEERQILLEAAKKLIDN